MGHSKAVKQRWWACPAPAWWLSSDYPINLSAPAKIYNSLLTPIGPMHHQTPHTTIAHTIVNSFISAKDTLDDDRDGWDVMMVIDDQSS